MMRMIQCVVLSLGFLVVAIAPVKASLITQSTSATEWDPIPTNNPLDDIALTLSGLPANPISDLSVTFRVRADLDLSNEFVEISIDGYSFGSWLDNKLANDSIDDTVDDSGGTSPLDQSAIILTGTTTIPLADFIPLIADGELTALFQFSSSVDDRADPPMLGFEKPEFAEFSISYEDANVSVPEPGSLTIFGVGSCLMAIGLVRRWRKVASPLVAGSEPANC